MAAPSPPPNDLPQNATPAEPGFSETLDTSGATSPDSEHGIFDECGFDGADRAVWYKVTLDRDATIHIDTSGSDYDAEWAVGVGRPVTGLSMYECFGDFAALANQTYYVGVVDYGFMPNAKMLRIAFTRVPMPPQAQATIDWRDAVRADGSVRLTGMYSCRHADAVMIQPSLVQTRRRGGENFTIDDARCDGRLHPWSHVVTAGTVHHFRPGWAFLTLDYISACHGGPCPSSVSNPTQTVTLYRASPGASGPTGGRS